MKFKTIAAATLAVATMLGMAVPTTPSNTSGLIEFQRWMKRWREKGAR